MIYINQFPYDSFVTYIVKRGRYLSFVSVHVAMICVDMICSWQYLRKGQLSRVGYHVLSGVLESIAAYFMAVSGIRASRVIFLLLISNIFRLPLSYFDRTPQGRVLNILSQDMADIDYVLPFSMRSMLNVILQALASFGIIVANLHLFVVVLLPLGIAYYFIQVQFLNYFFSKVSVSVLMQNFGNFQKETLMRCLKVFCHELVFSFPCQ